MMNIFIPNELKPTYHQLGWNRSFSFNVKTDIKEDLLNSYHYHPELELNLIRRSSGVRVIGPFISHFTDNDMVFIGKNVPHAFFHKQKHMDRNEIEPPEALVIQFNENFMGREFLELPEMAKIRQLFTQVSLGFCITDTGKKRIIPLLEHLFQASTLDRIIILLEILKIIADKNSRETLISNDIITSSHLPIDERINQVVEFTFKNYDQDIKIEEVAKIINMTKESFCRYFKAQTNKTYLEFLLEVRINRACNMIKDSQMPIKEIGYACGFNSLSNFHCQFKKIIKLSPLEFKEQENISF